jgi:hypothetical protein
MSFDLFIAYNINGTLKRSNNEIQLEVQ